MTVLKALAAMVATVIIPPLGLWLAQRRLILVLSSFVLFVMSQVLFWGFLALTGVLLWLVTIGLSLLLVVLPVGKRKSLP